jgi:hypothetical protein
MKRAPEEQPNGSLKILFSLLHPGYLRHYGQPIRLLAARGHRVHVALGRLEKDPGDFRLIEELARDCPTVTYDLAAARRRRDGWRRLAWLVRALTDLARYGDPRFAAAPALRQRIADKLHWRLDYSRLPGPLKAPLHRAVDRHSAGADATRARRTIGRLKRLEAAIPTSSRVNRYVAARAPDAVLASPVIEFASSQIEYLKSARRLGIRTGICVASWDNLTGKGLLRFVPDRVFVWNDVQAAELEEMHGIPADRIVRTGAQRFDEWFDRTPTADGHAFRAKVGLDPSVPYVLYLCSSPFIAPDEVGFVRRWAAAIRASSLPLAGDLGLLVRPHPQNGRQWQAVDLAELGNAAIWPPEGAQPDAGEARADYFDSLAHSACVVGINTSGLIEAAIVGKSTLTVLDPGFAGTQEGTLHFQYLRWENGGPLRVARDLSEHLAQLEQALAHGPEDSRQVARFVERFCRPQGLDRAAAPLVAAGIETLAASGPAPRARADVATLALRASLYPLATTMTAVSGTLGSMRWLRKRLLPLLGRLRYGRRAAPAVGSGS